MHIVDGALSTEVLIAGGVLTAGGIAMGLKELTIEKIPAAGVLSATFFVASLVHVSSGVSSVHLIMNGVCGLILGWTAFPALFIALLLQATFFGFGGITVLGVNTLNIALPAVIIYYVCRKGCASENKKVAVAWAAAGGAGAIALTASLVTLVLMLSGGEFMAAAKIAIVAHIPVMIIEGILSAFAVHLISRVKPELLSKRS